MCMHIQYYYIGGNVLYRLNQHSICDANAHDCNMSKPFNGLKTIIDLTLSLGNSITMDPEFIIVFIEDKEGLPSLRHGLYCAGTSLTRESMWLAYSI